MSARHGKLVLEEYFHGQSRDGLHDLRSATKSITATAIGAAMYAGVPLKLSTPVYELMKNYAPVSESDPQKRAMTLEHLLTMSSGFYCDDRDDNAPGSEERMNNQTEVRTASSSLYHLWGYTYGYLWWSEKQFSLTPLHVSQVRGGFATPVPLPNT